MKQFLLIFFTLFFSEFHPLQNRIAYFGLFERRIKITIVFALIDLMRLVFGSIFF